MSKPLSGQWAIVTGGGRGIGLAIATTLAEKGANLILCGRNQATLDHAAAILRTRGTTVRAIATDISQEADVLALFGQLDNDATTPAILINNAGIGIFGPITETSLETWESVQAVNVRGTFLCAREAMKRMIPARAGRIINIGSVVSLKGYANQGAYTASKHAMLGLTKVMAAEGREHDIIVQAICPGGVDTELVGDARPDLDTSILMQPEDIANAVWFCLQQTGNAITDIIQIRRRSSAPFA